MSFPNYSNYPPGVTGNEAYFADDDAGELCHRCEAILESDGACPECDRDALCHRCEAILESDGACPECDRDALHHEAIDRRIAAYWDLHEDDREGPPPEHFECWPHLQD